MADIFSLSKKMERAARNDTGFNVTAEEMRLLLDGGCYELVQAIKLRELQSACLGKQAHTSSENIGSTSGATARPLTPGRSQPISPAAAKSYIAALSAEA